MDDFEFGFQEPSVIPLGRCTLRQALNFISDHQTDPQKWTAATIATEYQLDQQVTGKRFCIFCVLLG